MRRRERILVTDDDPGVVDFLVEALNEQGYEAAGAVSAAEALARVEGEDLDMLITDVEMPGMRGTELLAAVQARRPRLLVLLITAFGSIEMAVQAVRVGACDFVAKPFKIEALLFAIERAFEERTMRREIVRLRRRLSDTVDGELVAKSDAMRRALDLARRSAATDSTVLLTGESGTGKGAIARYIHDHSRRRDAAFVHVNCAALPAPLVESELFGARKGAYTDLHEDRPGRFVEADHGTLFLDEIAEMSLEIQAKLLLTLETGRVRPLGSGAETTADVRIIAATNRSLEEALRERRFRPDLYYRLNVIRLDLPPLRERPEDIPDLVDVFLHRLTRRMQTPVLGVSDEAMRWLLSHGWPGNVRELANLLERAVALTEHTTITLEDLVLRSDPLALLDKATSSGLSLEELERAYVARVLEASNGNMARAARVLGIDRRTLYRKIERRALSGGPRPPADA
ncbi:MAG TPA: sigma-54 dependent transcriptional regulator [Candidatus Polarisedimenticolia bacterium]|nr:sigma-54 dependent transcriptional regulator [Candidatus Polarisedimenticolia bacterium]